MLNIVYENFFGARSVTAPRPKRSKATDEASNFLGNGEYVTRITLASIGKGRQSCGL